MTIKRCEMCGEDFDTAGCNQTYAIHTTVVDSDEYGTKKNRVYLCGYCNLKVKNLIERR